MTKSWHIHNWNIPMHIMTKLETYIRNLVSQWFNNKYLPKDKYFSKGKYLIILIKFIFLVGFWSFGVSDRKLEWGRIIYGASSLRIFFSDSALRLVFFLQKNSLAPFNFLTHNAIYWVWFRDQVVIAQCLARRLAFWSFSDNFYS